MKQSKNNSSDNIVQGRLSAGPNPPKPGAARQSSAPSYGANRLGIVSNDDAAEPAAQAPAQMPAQPPTQVPSLAPGQAPAPIVACVAVPNPSPAPAPAPPASLAQQQAMPRQSGPAAQEPHLGATGDARLGDVRMGVSPGKAGNGQARPGAQTPAAFIHKDAASPAQGLRPMFAPLQQAPTAGPTLPALSRAHGLSGVPRRETSRLGEPAKATGRSVVDELWNTPGAMGLADEAPQSGAGARQKKMLVGGGVILLVAIVWACWPSSDKAAYRPTPQAAQAAPAEAQPVPQPDRGPGTAPVTPNGTLAPAVNPGAVPAYIGASPARPGGRTEPGPAMPDENHGQAPAMSPEPAPDGDAHPAATTMPAQDIAPSKPTAGAEPAKPLERQYRPCPSGIRLTGIVQQAGRKVACINGKFRDVGDRVCGATVVEIKDLSVEMEQDGQRFLVGFGSPTDAASDDEAPADEDKSSSQDTPKANKPDPDTQPADPPQPPTKKKHKSKPADE